MNSQEIISVYENVAVLTGQMLDAARTGDWEQLTLLESRCSSQVECLRKGELPAALPANLRDRKVAIIKKILADDHEIRSITEPWMKQLSSMLNSAGTERKLSQAYGSPPGG
jgi:flagellar protein FliT